MLPVTNRAEGSNMGKLVLYVQAAFFFTVSQVL